MGNQEHRADMTAPDNSAAMSAMHPNRFAGPRPKGPISPGGPVVVPPTAPTVPPGAETPKAPEDEPND